MRPPSVLDVMGGIWDEKLESKNLDSMFEESGKNRYDLMDQKDFFLKCQPSPLFRMSLSCFIPLLKAQ